MFVFQCSHWSYQDCYHPDVNVLFQEDAWADTSIVTKWTKTPQKQHVEENLGGKAFVLYQDNRKAHFGGKPFVLH